MTTMNELFQTGGKPIPTKITSGTGTWVPSVDNALCRIRAQSGGGGGFTSVAGGGGGAMVEFWLRIPIAGLAYAVGAGGAVSAAGSDTSFGQFVAKGGGGASGTSSPGLGGIVGRSMGSVNSTATTIIIGGTLAGVSGGHGGSGTTTGGLVGNPLCNSSLGTFEVSPAAGGLDMQNGYGFGSGGDSFFGKGGVSGASPGATAYGAGGGVNAAGRGGCIEIEDFGA